MVVDVLPIRVRCHYKGVLADRDSEYVLKSMPTAFTLGLGFAF